MTKNFTEIRQLFTDTSVELEKEIKLPTPNITYQRMKGEAYFGKVASKYVVKTILKSKKDNKEVDEKQSNI